MALGKLLRNISCIIKLHRDVNTFNIIINNSSHYRIIKFIWAIPIIRALSFQRIVCFPAGCTLHITPKLLKGVCIETVNHKTKIHRIFSFHPLNTFYHVQHRIWTGNRSTPQGTHTTGT